MFGGPAREVPPDPPDVSKLIDILQNPGVTVAA